MFFSKIAIASALVAVASALTISSPASLIECQPVSLTWTDGTEPFYLAVLPGGDVSATALESLTTATSSPETWTVNLASGTNVTIRITDSTGTQAYTSAIVIQAGSDSSCLTSSTTTSSSDSSTSAAASDASSASAASGTTSSASGASAASTTAASTTSSSSSSSTTTASSGALFTREMAGGFAAVLGFVATAFGILA